MASKKDLVKMERVLKGGHGGFAVRCVTSTKIYVITGGLDCKAVVWERGGAGKIVRTLEGHRGSVLCLDTTPCEKYVVTGSWDSTLILWKLSNGNRERSFVGHTHWVSAVAVTPSGDGIVSGSMDKTAILWNIHDSSRLLTFKGHEGFVIGVVVSSSGLHLYTCSYDKTAIKWSMKTGERLDTFRGHEYGVYSCCLTSDDKYLITASHDKTAIVWNADDTTRLRTLKGHSNLVTSICISSRAPRIVATGSNDGTVILWDFQTATPVCTLRDHARNVQCVHFSKDSKHLLTSSFDGTAIQYDVSKLLASPSTPPTSSTSASVASPVSAASLSSPSSHPATKTPASATTSNLSSSTSASPPKPPSTSSSSSATKTSGTFVKGEMMVTRPSSSGGASKPVPLRLATSRFRQLYTAINATWRDSDYWKASDKTVKRRITSMLANFIEAYAKTKSIDARKGETFVDELMDDVDDNLSTAHGHSTAEAMAVLLWTSAKTLHVSSTRMAELCSILNEIIRTDGGNAAFEDAVRLVCMIQHFLNASRRNAKFQVLPMGPDAPLGKGRSTKRDTVFRGGGLPAEHLQFFKLLEGKDLYFRAPHLVATSFSIRTANRFIQRVPKTLPKVQWIILIDEEYGCFHVNYIDNALTTVKNESEYLFSVYSAFKVVKVEESTTPTNWMTPHKITLYAAPDNSLVSEDVPTSPWC